MTVATRPEEPPKPNRTVTPGCDSSNAEPMASKDSWSEAAAKTVSVRSGRSGWPPAVLASPWAHPASSARVVVTAAARTAYEAAYAAHASAGTALETLRAACAGDPDGGPIAAERPGIRFRWLTAPRSTVVQPGPVHSGVTTDPAAELTRLFAKLDVVTRVQVAIVVHDAGQA